MAGGAVEGAGTLELGCVVALWALHIGGQTNAASARMQERDVHLPIISPTFCAAQYSHATVLWSPREGTLFSCITRKVKEVIVVTRSFDRFSSHR
jgi:hypothetical protein